MRTFLAVILIALSLAAPAQQDPDTLRRAVEQVEETLKQRPNDANLWFFLARFRAEAGDATGATAALEKAAALGDGFMPAPQLGFERVWNDAQFKAAVARLEAKLPRLDYAPAAFEIEDRELIPEGIAYDAKTQSFFLGSTAERKILRVDSSHSVSEFAGASADLDAVLGIAVDGPRRRLYAVTTSALTDAGQKRLRNAVVAFDVDSGRVLQRYDVPSARQLNDVTVAMGGRIFASDSASGAVYELRNDAAPRVLVAPGELRGSNGIAASPDGKRLFVAHSTGIASVDAASGTLQRLANATRETVAAIDGLYEYQGDLIGVQNVTTPGRVILMSLSRDGSEITRVRTLLSHHHSGLFEPTTGAVNPESGYFYLLGATGVSRLNRKGSVDSPETVPHPTVLRVLLPR